MRKIYLLLTLLCFGGGLQAQTCTPDPIILLLGVPGIYPNQATGGMTDGEINTPYTQIFTAVVPNDTTIDLSQFGIPLGTVTLAIDALEVTGVNGLPSGLSYACDASGCSWAGGDNGCFKVSGTPTQAGTFTVDIQTTITLTIPSFGPFTTPPVPVSVDLVINDPNAVAPALNGFTVGNASPNPGRGLVQIPFTCKNAGAYNFTVTDLNGRTVFANEVNANSGVNTLELNTAAFSAGLYHFRFEQNGAIATGKLVVAE